MFDETYEVYTKVQKWVNQDLRTALATVIRTWKSSPRPLGSQMAINQNGEFVGSLSGGCIEGEVIEQALEVMSTGKSKRLVYGVTHQDALGAGLSCGGSIEVYVEPCHPDLDFVSKYLASRRSFAALSQLSSGITEYLDYDSKSAFGSEQLVEVVKKGLRNGENKLLESVDSDYFLRSHVGPLSLYVVGAVHISQALIPMAKIAGFEVVLIDPRSAFANEQRFPDTKILCSWPQEVFPSLVLDERSAVVVLSHDPKFDDPSLKYALESDAFYLGALGSKKSHKSRLERLEMDGFSKQQLDRIHGPIGLDIGGKTSSHIAVAILAQLIACLN